MNLMRFKYVIPIALAISMLSGCMDRINEVLDSFDFSKKETTPSVSIITAPKIMFDDIIYALDNKDKEHLKSLFAPNALTLSPNIDAQIDEIMDFYKGKSIYDGIVDDGRSSRHTINGKYVYLTMNPNISDFKTDRASYSLRFFAVCVDAEDSNQVGLWIIRLFRDGDPNKECKVGAEYLRKGY
jgi:hypothetical protein